ncbi:MFS family permease [Endobacter medicaginis]|uniref:MFS family permease n=1 Tax=Endobacter medicaginis TaxID=1181271 RepID=A0A839UYV2_9PROT|nr:MFS transporter [Endobacter medicaginis]MBB3173533.1 MFS family permease [Endobacter medicaginis]MCX5475378.1 MFS transporter [Endobacter medicaginis]NVN29835.1 MFS transporter [Endobacter medicaginis]
MAVASPSPRKRMLIGICAGNFLEFYNFGVYAFFAPMLAAAYFPKGDHLVALTLALLTFAIGFLARPVGAAVVAAYAARAGRRAALMLTFSLMGLGSALIALTPGYNRIGIAAPVIVLLGRLIQGFSDGGEVGPATTLLFDLEAAHGRGGIVSLQYITQLCAMLVSVMVGAVLAAVLPHDALYGWGWRVPFLLGLMVVPVGLFIRGSETMDHAPPPQPAPVTTTAPVAAIALVLTVIACGTIGTYMRAYGVSYAVSVLHLSPGIGMLAMSAGLATGILATIAGIPLAARIGTIPLVLASTLAAMVLTWPLYHHAITTPGLSSQLLLNIALFAITNLPAGVLWKTMLGALPERNRSLAFGLIYALAVSIFGGFTQPVVTWLITVTGSAMVPAWVSIALAPVGTAALLLLLRKQRGTQTRAAPALA